MKILKSIGAVLVGIIFIFVTHTGMDLLLESFGIFTPPDKGFHTTWMVVTATIYRTVLSSIAAFITAKLAPSQPLKHALILGLIGLALCIAAAIITIPMDIAPAWYPIALAVLSVPAAWVGGSLAERRSAEFS